MQYFLVSNDPDRRRGWHDRLTAAGLDIVEEYDPSAVIVTIGGDGTILYAARKYPEPRILPVRAGTSKGNRAAFDVDHLVENLQALEAGNAAITTRQFSTLTAETDGEQLADGFRALNEISLHHSSPVLAATFAVRIEDGSVREFPELIGDGVLVATPFGSTGYFTAITGQTFTEGFGVAFNNIHTPADTPEFVLCSESVVVEFELLSTKRSSGAVLTRDDDSSPYELSEGQTVTIRAGDRTVELLDVV